MFFPSARKKITRAETHIRDLEREFAAFAATKPYRFICAVSPHGQQWLQVQFTRSPPDTLSLVIGDAVHNLRAALDHMAWDMAMYGKGRQDRFTAFPFAENKALFEAKCDAITTKSRWVKDAFRAIEAFPIGRGDDLYYINKMDNADKHTSVALMLKATRHPPITVYPPADGPSYQIDNELVTGAFADKVTVASLPKSYRLEFDGTADCVPMIFSEKVEHVEHLEEPTIPMLRRFLESVRDTVKILESSLPTPLII